MDLIRRKTIQKVCLNFNPLFEELRDSQGDPLGNMIKSCVSVILH